jgi:hypothetical protein
VKRLGLFALSVALLAIPMSVAAHGGLGSGGHRSSQGQHHHFHGHHFHGLRLDQGLKRCASNSQLAGAESTERVVAGLARGSSSIGAAFVLRFDRSESMSDLVNISPNYRGGDVDLTKLDDRIKVYEDQITGWFFRPAKALLKTPHSAFAVLHLLMGYFESHTIYRRGESSKGKGKSQAFFREGFTAVFPKAASSELPGVNLEEVSQWIADAMYDDARCGLFHEWMTRARIALTEKPELMRGSHDRDGRITEVTINVDKFLAMIETHFTAYIRRLKDPNNVADRMAFNAGWEITH